MKYVFIFIFITPVYARNLPLFHNGLRITSGNIPLSADIDADPDLEFFYIYKFLYVNPVIHSISLKNPGMDIDFAGGVVIDPNWIIGAGVIISPKPEIEERILRAALFQLKYLSEVFDSFLEFSTYGGLVWTATYQVIWMQPIRISLIYTNHPVSSLLFSFRPEFFLYFSPEFSYDFLLNEINFRANVSPDSRIILNFEIGYFINKDNPFFIGISYVVNFENKFIR